MYSHICPLLASLLQFDVCPPDLFPGHFCDTCPSLSAIAPYGFVSLPAPALPSRQLKQYIAKWLAPTHLWQTILLSVSLIEVKYVPSCSGFAATTISSATIISSFSMALAYYNSWLTSSASIREETWSSFLICPGNSATNACTSLLSNTPPYKVDSLQKSAK